MKILLKERKSSVLSPSALKCLNDTPTINPTAGCVHLCSYCYARGYSNYPGDGTIMLYTNLTEKLESELSRKRKAPGFVYFSPSCDAFQPVKQQEFPQKPFLKSHNLLLMRLIEVLQSVRRCFFEKLG